MICTVCRREIQGKGLVSREFGVTHTGCAFIAYKKKYGKKLSFGQIYPFSRWYRFKMSIVKMFKPIRRLIHL